MHICSVAFIGLLYGSHYTIDTSPRNQNIFYHTFSPEEWEDLGKRLTQSDKNEVDQNNSFFIFFLFNTSASGWVIEMSVAIMWFQSPAFQILWLLCSRIGFFTELKIWHEVLYWVITLFPILQYKRRHKNKRVKNNCKILN